MGKKSLIKSTSKKSAPKKAASAVETTKKAAANKAAPTKKPAPKSTPPKNAAPTSNPKPVSIKDLLWRKFDIVTPEVRYTVPTKMVGKPLFTAPERLAGFDSKDVQRIKGLLFNVYGEKELKAAAEKAAAEKAAAEKAEAIKKAAAQKSEVTVAYEPPPAKMAVKKPSDPVDNTIKLFAAGLAFLILLVIGASASNSFKYYLTENQGALEIWKGKFAPMGKKMIIALPGTPAPQTSKSTYSAGDVYPLVFQYYIDKADALLDVPGIPDFEGIKTALHAALEYGSTNTLREIAYTRLDNIDRLILIYKADVAASRGTIDDLTSAIGLLKEADRLTTDTAQETLIAQKIQGHEAAIAVLEEQAAAEQAEAEAITAETSNSESEVPAETGQTVAPDTSNH